MLQKLHTKIKKKKHLGEFNDDTTLLDNNACLYVAHRLQDQLNAVKGWEVPNTPLTAWTYCQTVSIFLGHSRKHSKAGCSCWMMKSGMLW